MNSESLRCLMHNLLFGDLECRKVTVLQFRLEVLPALQNPTFSIQKSNMFGTKSEKCQYKLRTFQYKINIFTLQNSPKSITPSPLTSMSSISLYATHTLVDIISQRNEQLSSSSIVLPPPPPAQSQRHPPSHHGMAVIYLVLTRCHQHPWMRRRPTGQGEWSP